MSYDDERVIALLRESVPAAPETADRLDAVRRKAGHQRTMAWTQTLGVAASVLLVLGFVAVATGASGKSGTIEPTAKPLEALAAAMGKQSSLRFEARVTPIGDLTLPDRRVTKAERARVLTSHVTGAATKDGDLQVDGDLSLMSAFSLGFGEVDTSEEDMHWRFVDGQSYRSATSADEVPPGKTWVAEEGASETSAADLDRLLSLVRGVAEDVRFVRSTTVRGTPVAEYRFSVPERYVHQPLEITFAIDDEDRLRRVSTELSLLAVIANGEDDAFRGGMGADPLTVRVELELFGYGDDVRVTAPPAAEVVSAESLYERQNAELERCIAAAGKDEKQAMACYRQEFGSDFGEGGIEPTDECVSLAPTASPEDAAMACGVIGIDGDTATASAAPTRPSPASTRSPSP